MAQDKYVMRYREIIEAEAIAPLTPKQLQKRAERQRRQQQRIRDEQARSAAKLRDLQSDTP